MSIKIIKWREIKNNKIKYNFGLNEKQKGKSTKIAWLGLACE